MRILFSNKKKSKYLYHALNLALERITDDKFKWQNICDEAAEKIKQFEACEQELQNTTLKIWVSGYSIARWLSEYRSNNGYFTNHPLRLSRINQWPPIFNYHPDIIMKFITFGKCNLDVPLTAESMHHYMMNELVPEVVSKVREEVDLTQRQILKLYKLLKLCIGTIYNWMGLVGFKQNVRRKAYYVDEHEHPYNVLYRKRYIQEYLKLEYRCFLWIVLNEANVKELEEEDNKFLRKYGFKFVENGNTFYEFHVDDHPSFQDRCKYLQFGDHISKRKNVRDKSVIMIGQDEAIFKQYLLTL